MTGMVLRLVLRGLKDLRSHFWAQLFTLAAVTLSAFLAGLFLLLIHNLDQQLLKHHGEITYQVYWKPGTSDAELKKQWDSLRKFANLSTINTYTPSEALHQLADAMDRKVSLSWAKNSPLPPTATLSFTIPADAATTAQSEQSWSDSVHDRLGNLPGVADVHFNPLQAESAQTWLTVSRRAIWPLIGLLGLVAALIVGNTIKLSQISRKDEVEILSLVGAKSWFIELPLLSAGAFQGFLGGLLAAGILKAFQLTIENTLNTPPLFLHIAYLPLEWTGVLVCGMTTIGLVSGWVAVKK